MEQMRCLACAEKGINTVLGRIDHSDGKYWGTPNSKQIEHSEISRQWFLKYCDSNECIRGSYFVLSALNKGWHDGLCLECTYNPYNHKAIREGA